MCQGEMCKRTRPHIDIHTHFTHIRTHPRTDTQEGTRMNSRNYTHTFPLRAWTAECWSRESAHRASVLDGEAARSCQSIKDGRVAALCTPGTTHLKREDCMAAWLQAGSQQRAQAAHGERDGVGWQCNGRDQGSTGFAHQDQLRHGRL